MTSLRISLLGFGLWFAVCTAVASAENAALAPPLIAQAGVTGDPAAPESDSQNDALFVALDKNHDGFLSETEANDEVRDFDRADANGDGRLDPAEFDTARSDSEATDGIDPNPHHDTD